MEDEDYMKMRSDWTEFVPTVGDDSSYITTYRLPQSHYYVIAKSWYAPEMSRPGCVWTHSFIINLEEISRDFDFRALFHFFRRPKAPLTGYDTPLNIANEETWQSSMPLDNFSLKEIAYLYNILLQGSHESFLAEYKSVAYQILILSILQYLPVKAIGDLYICSGTSANPTGVNNEMNLSFSNSVACRLHDVASIENIPSDSTDLGLVYFANAIKKQNSKIDKILRTFSSDIQSNSEKLSTFGYLLYGLEKPEETTFQQILAQISSSFPNKNEGVRIKEAFLTDKVVKLFTTLDAFYLDLCVNDYQNAIDFSEKYPYSTVEQYICRDYNTFQLFLNNVVSFEHISTYGRELLQYTANKISEEWQQKLFEENWSLYLSLLNLAQSWLYHTYWLYAPKSKISLLLSVFEEIDLSKFEDWSTLMNRTLCLDIQLNDTIKNAISEYYPDGVKDCLQYIQEGNCRNELCTFLCKKDIPSVIKWMKSQHHYTKESVYFIVDIVPPTSIDVKQGGSQHWFDMLPTIKELDKEKLYVFLYQLSFNWTDCNALAMLKFSFWKLYELCENNHFSNANIYTLASYFAELPPWQWWDNCKKMRKGLVKAMKKMGYQRSDIKNFTPSEDLNKTLMKIWDK